MSRAKHHRFVRENNKKKTDPHINHDNLWQIVSIKLSKIDCIVRIMIVLGPERYNQNNET